jgi:hypothetical protein
MSDSKGLASTWPASGPKKLWSRSLAKATPRFVRTVCTRCARRQITRQPSVSHEEVVAALDAASGKTIWEFKYPPTPAFNSTRASVLTARRIVGNRLRRKFTQRAVHLDKRPASIWSHDFRSSTRR